MKDGRSSACVSLRRLPPGLGVALWAAAALVVGSSPAASAGDDGTGQPAAAASTAAPVPLLPPLTTVPAPATPLPAAALAPTEVDSSPVADLPPLVLPEPELVYRRRYNFTIIGSSLLVATWAADRLLARDLPDTGQSWLPWLPLAGPWYLLYSQQQLAAPNPLTSAMLVFDGLLQAGGLTVGILGFVLHNKRMVMSLPPATKRSASP